MEALQLLVDMVKDLPEMAIWVILAFFLYKTLIIGSIYGVIKYCSKLFHDAYVTKKTEVKEVDFRVTCDGITISRNLDCLLAQVMRLRGVSKRSDFKNEYIHDSDITWLKEAIDEKLNKEGKKTES